MKPDSENKVKILFFIFLIDLTGIFFKAIITTMCLVVHAKVYACAHV